MNRPHPLKSTPSVYVNGHTLSVYSTGVAEFCTAEVNGKVSVRVVTENRIEHCTIHPLRLGVDVTISGNVAEFTLPRAENLWIQIPGIRPLYLFTHPARAAEGAAGPRVRSFNDKGIHEVGELDLTDGETLHIGEGTIVRGSIYAQGEGIRICGGGILDGSLYTRENRHNLIRANACKGLRIEDITLVYPTTWMVVLGKCEDVVVSNIHEIGEVVTSDGIDVVGSKRVLIEDCFLRNNDDCVVAKAIDFSALNTVGRQGLDWRADVEDLLVQRCTFWNDHAGNAMEVGFETRTEQMHRITFRDIDVIGAHGNGAVFSIHAGDRAMIKDVLWENIRVEHFWEKLVDLRVLHSRYSKDETRGQIRDITFRNIRTIADIHNTPSLIGGYDAEHTVEGVLFEDFRIGEAHVLSDDALHLFKKQAAQIEYR